MNMISLGSISPSLSLSLSLSLSFSPSLYSFFFFFLLLLLLLSSHGLLFLLSSHGLLFLSFSFVLCSHDYCQGGDLFNYLWRTDNNRTRATPFDERFARHLFFQLMSALTFMHEVCICCRSQSITRVFITNLLYFCDLCATDVLPESLLSSVSEFCNGAAIRLRALWLFFLFFFFLFLLLF